MERDDNSRATDSSRAVEWKIARPRSALEVILAADDTLTAELAGDLPCVRCRYNLRGLTIRGMCPECGTSVRTTVLARVDPMANELRPIRFRRLVAFGMVAWAAGGLLAACFNWLLRLGDLVAQNQIARSPQLWQRYGLLLGVGASAVGALLLVRPHDRIPARQRLMAAMGVALYAPLLWALWLTHCRLDLGPGVPYITNAPPDPRRIGLRILTALLIAAILTLLRPNARLLQSRWLLMRIGAVGRQTILALLAVLALWVVGDVMVLIASGQASGTLGVLSKAGELIILVASLLLTVGLVGMVVDCARVQGVIVQPALTLDDMLGPPGSSRPPARQAPPPTLGA